MKRGRFESNTGRNDRPGKFEVGSAQTAKSDRSAEDRNFWQSVLLYVHDLVYLLGIGLVVLLLLFRVVVVSGSSMKQTLLDGDYLLLLSSTVYSQPKHGDIVVVSKDSFENGVPIVKRVIATEGQTVDIDFVTGVVYVDGVALDEPYVSSEIRDEGVQFPLTVDEGCLFVMGDNRYVSQDSRSPEIGLVDKREVLGKAILLFLPGTDKGSVSRDFSRIGVLS